MDASIQDRGICGWAEGRLGHISGFGAYLGQQYLWQGLIQMKPKSTLRADDPKFAILNALMVGADLPKLLKDIRRVKEDHFRLQFGGTVALLPRRESIGIVI